MTTSYLPLVEAGLLTGAAAVVAFLAFPHLVALVVSAAALGAAL
jgi:hypothetical protein